MHDVEFAELKSNAEHDVPHRPDWQSEVFAQAFPKSVSGTSGAVALEDDSSASDDRRGWFPEEEAEEEEEAPGVCSLVGRQRHQAGLSGDDRSLLLEGELPMLVDSSDGPGDLDHDAGNTTRVASEGE
eukprot:jgi/Tetstr1/423577/TSEL_014249.t1